MSEFNPFSNNSTLKEIEELDKKFLEMKESLNSITNLEEKFKKLWELKDASQKIKYKYSFLNNLKQDNYIEQYSNWLKEEIFYFETCLKMKVNHVGVLRNDFRHFLDCAILEYEYFIDLKKEITQEFFVFTTDNITLSLSPHLNLMYQNLHDSILCILGRISRINDNYTFFIEYEILGNLYLQLSNFLSKFHSVPSDYSQIFLRLSYHYYLQSINYLNILNQQKPQTAFMGVNGTGINFFPLYYEFFEEEGILRKSVREKADYLVKKSKIVFENNVFENLERNLLEFDNYFENKDYEKALQGYSNILKLKPLDFSIWIKKCTILFELNRADEAEKCIKCLIRIDPMNWVLLKEVIDTLMKFDKKELTLSYIERYSKEDSNDIEYLKNLGNIYVNLNKYEKAQELYEKSLNILDTDLDTIVALSACKIMSGEYNLAMELIEKGKSIKSDDPKLNEIKSKLDKIGEAQKIIKDLQEIYDEVQFDIIIEKVKVDQSLLIKILESMIKKQEINAKIKGNSLAFFKETKAEESKKEQLEGVFIGRGGYWEVNRFHFKIKIKNNSSNVITNIRVIIDKFPDTLKLESQELFKSSHLEPEGGLWTPEFKLYAGDDCVSGKIHASIKFFDSTGKSIDYDLEPFEISYICPLLEAKNLDEINYLRRTKKMNKLEKEIQLNVDYDSSKLLEEITSKMEKMNLGIIKHDEDINSLYGYAEDKINHDGLALETEIKSLIDGQTNIIIKAICEKENKCASLLHKAVGEITELELSLEKSMIIDKLNMFIDKPNDLNKYIKKILKANWSDNKKDLWAKTVQEILEDWKTFQPKKWVKIGKAILKFTVSTIASEKLGDLITFGFERLFEWIKINLG